MTNHDLIIDRYNSELFNIPFVGLEGIDTAASSKDIKLYRMKTIVSGPMLECEIYPVWNTSKKSVIEKVKRDDKIQKAINRRNLEKRIIRMMNANFTNEDMWITVGYRKGEEPADMKQAKKDVINYIRRIKRLSPKPLKYIYVTEISEKGRAHHHIVMNFHDRDLAENKWGLGEYPQARRLQPNDYGLEGMARYIAKDLKGQKSYGYSLGLIKPWLKAKIVDGKMSKRKCLNLMQGRVDAQSFFEKVYQKYKFLQMESKVSEYVDGCYLYVKMNLKEEIKRQRE